VCGAELAAGLLPVAGERSGEDASAAVVGLVGAPAVHRASRRTLFLFANGRAITSRPLTHAIEEAYGGLIPAGRHPAGILHVTVPPDEVDVNVHPTKAEVRFRHERLVYATVASAVRAAITGAATPVAPAPGSLEAAPWAPGRAVIAGATAAGHAWTSPAQPAWGPPDAGGDRDGGPAVLEGAEPAGSQAPLPMRERLPALRSLGQLDATYLVAEAPDGLYLVDQHAAHERVLYEQVLAARAAGQPAVQPLLAAVAVSLPAAHAALVAEQAEALAAVGFTVEPADGAAVLIRAVPALLAGQDPERALLAYLERFEREDRLSGPDRAAASLACRAAVMAGDRLDAEQQRALLRALEATEAPQTCPHGRPTMLHLSTDALARSFGRR
jgi:DNA mismatch repair protein MutL